MAEDAQELEQAAKLPFSERVAHKNWKVRSEAYADIRSACERAASADDLAIPDIGAPVRASASTLRVGAYADARGPACRAATLLAKASSDSNAAALDKALDAVLAYLTCASETGAAR